MKDFKINGLFLRLMSIFISITLTIILIYLGVVNFKINSSLKKLTINVIELKTNEDKLVELTDSDNYKTTELHKNIESTYKDIQSIKVFKVEDLGRAQNILNTISECNEKVINYNNIVEARISALQIK
ncbi:hypothetical protein D3C81_08370 [compost metagenome]